MSEAPAPPATPITQKIALGQLGDMIRSARGKSSRAELARKASSIIGRLAAGVARNENEEWLYRTSTVEERATWAAHSLTIERIKRIEAGLKRVPSYLEPTGRSMRASLLGICLALGLHRDDVSRLTGGF